MELGGGGHDKPRVFLLSTTNGGETHALAAAKTTLNLLKDGSISQHLWSIGQRLMDGFNDLAKEFGIADYVQMRGMPCSPFHLFLGTDGRVDLSLRTLYLQETIRHGVLIPYIAPSSAHGDREIEETLEASRKAMPLLRHALEAENYEGLLVGPAVKPVFRKYN
ncbi:glutamate-1-semialdehyde 2,1-aminomutase [compost metagenome]